MNKVIDNILIGRLIKLTRVTKSYSQGAVAFDCGYSHKATLSRIESGKIQIDLQKFQKICTSMKCNCSDIFLLAEYSVRFRLRINSWDDFISSIIVMESEDQKKLLLLVESIFPKKIMEIKSIIEETLQNQAVK